MVVYKVICSVQGMLVKLDVLYETHTACSPLSIYIKFEGIGSELL